MEDILRRFFFHVPAGLLGGDRLDDPQLPRDGRLRNDDDDDVEGHGDFRWNSADRTSDDMFNHFDRQFEQIFNTFFGPYRGNRSLALPPGSPLHDPRMGLSLRDQLLKRDHGDERKDDTYSRQDTDLDVAVSTQGLAGIGDVEPRTSSRSFFSTTRITVQGADGKVEERLTKRDSAGNEETIVTRQLGDLSHRVVTRRDKDGVQQHQDLVNMDEGKLGEFNERWTSPPLGYNKDEQEQSRALAIFGGDRTAPTLFHKLFGSLLPSTKPCH